MTTVLLVEDDQVLRQMYKHKLELAGYQVVEASNGLEGIEIAQKIKPDLVIADIQMPILNGLEMMKQFKQSDWSRQIKIILLTNKEPDDAIVRAVTSEEPAYYLVKANNRPDSVLEKVNELLKEGSNG